MSRISRRNFIQLSATVVAATPYVVSAGSVSPGSGDLSSREDGRWDVGIYVNSLNINDVECTFSQIRRLGFKHAEIYTDKYDMSLAGPISDAMEKYEISVHALFTLGPGPTTWNFYEGQINIGLVSKEYRDQRVDALKRLSDLAKACNIPMVETHVGFISEDPNDPNYEETVEAIEKVVGHCKKNGQIFLYHAGQESPTTTVRCIEDVGYDNQGIGMDTANLILYDRGHPTYALCVYKDLIKLVNCKDGLFPTNTRDLGKEVRIGAGKVDFSEFITKLKDNGYTGPVIIEREDAGGNDWEKDVTWSKEYIEILLNS